MQGSKRFDTSTICERSRRLRRSAFTPPERASDDPLSRRHRATNEGAEVVARLRHLAPVHAAQEHDEIEAHAHDREDAREGDQRVEVPRSPFGTGQKDLCIRFEIVEVI